MEKICTICNKEYNIQKRFYDKSKFCSNDCRKASYKLSDVHMFCNTCGHSFVRKQNELKSSKGSYCSSECYEKRSPQQLIKCECGKDFYAYASRVSYYNKLYCSNECKYKYQLSCSLTDSAIELNNYQKFVAKLRHTANYQRWKKGCLERDQFSCSCGSKDRITVHHKFQMLDFVKKHGMNQAKIESDLLFFDISNGVTRCRSCHFADHHK